ncbi:D-lyxose/D-mannose family sugar isomerase [Alphaproteobacteria bacterium]|jgi:D-lyxose ketol-isomerase|nr:D-lyxose/D-mannose family sugar isomerase [Alphaproteobacteria bacterium]MDB2371171.1 D-lyxose/D-mannose family sugar isomerase [Alphaproteobacteria bacterium]|tara:strand:+ start:50 stop:715 length:666 start_codon:yes stop_codon:yes gene_type:complete
MKRSEINQAIIEAKKMMENYSWVLPQWGYWSKEDYINEPSVSKYLKDHQMGWDVTDFGKGLFNEQGITLFCIRNGIQGNAQDKPYAEKLLFMREGQEIPFHSHKVKLEDIINRGGGDLAIEFVMVNEHLKEKNENINILVDGVQVEVEPHEPLILKRGQSVTVERNIYHKFYAVKGTGMVMAGEVSQVNDDNNDNYFLEPVGRFTQIEEDEQPIHPLWNEI